MTSGITAPALAAGAALAAVAGVRALVADRPAPAPSPGSGLVGRLPAGRRLARRLERTGARLGPDAFVALVAALAAGAGLLVWALLRIAPLAPLGAVAVLAGARALLASADRRYVLRVAAQLPLVSQQLASALGAGLSLRQALGRAARDAPEPAAAELRLVVAELDLGARVEEALEALAARLPDPDLRIMVTAILVQRRTGGNLARALAELSERLEERVRLARELRGATAQARMSAWIVAALPVVGGIMAELAAPGMIARNLGHGPGLALLATATALELVGVLWIRRIGLVEP
ncbi:MAG: tight adherence protein [Miltoncostaeaceae bacterium]|jgi:tight adherence protein B|nr:tight adherence protein [Miltoncostaeaceae bacterium]